MLAAQRAIDHLSKLSVSTASVQSISEGGEYAMPARTREELLATQAMAADAREIPREAKKKDLADPALAAHGIPQVRKNGVVIMASDLVRDLFPKPPVEEEKPPDKWLM